MATLGQKELTDRAARAAARATANSEEYKHRQGMRDELEHLLQMIAKMLSPDTGLSGINISQVITKWERREWEGASAKFESVSNYLNDLMMKLSVDLGLWI
jgi:hypothetical protein